ncbi:hypothetical protein OsI_33623 [Oryza sativa Indica Group]|uniref:Uncharacterized protein n=1 Tax=Oryza sativa subsp. indica TaxID=39946 RepID=B8BGW4_ORYSI|nr:hypothetical protein OsI_33623 [Oryza sativa Indica Group]
MVCGNVSTVVPMLQHTSMAREQKLVLDADADDDGLHHTGAGGKQQKLVLDAADDGLHLTGVGGKQHNLVLDAVTDGLHLAGVGGKQHNLVLDAGTGSEAAEVGARRRRRWVAPHRRRREAAEVEQGKQSRRKAKEVVNGERETECVRAHRKRETEAVFSSAQSLNFD